ncbi:MULTISPECIES: terminase family protein [unclassified Pseudodesulfovibrio]|uniref:terminase large subunit domain-containing protein n=1 Tax=unclassified Pseudodesulfovibrio TaxID=2661612 RepID=UPI000FEB8376|nr:MULTISPECIES: terminase family protein [unclassified Pseudodesulfovibrio]MCJ2164646.1 terminase family protein [Pseudodesulfovibrio sp. S3-i]RWU04162.1 terminase [Pseudodesulfovibrio sp. S3]
MNQHADEVIQAAKSMYLRGNKVNEICKALGIPKRTVYHWRGIGNWNDLLVDEGALQCVARRYTLLIERDGKTERELKELDRLLEHMVRLREMQVREMEAANEERDQGKPPVGGRTRRPKKKRGKIIKNDVSHLTAQDFKDAFHSHYYEYQHELRRNKHHRTRNILKSRQIGATWYFAQEAFEDATLTGDNQIFLSATRRQADVFRSYIVAVAKEKFDIELKGKDEIVLHTAHGTATLYFLSNNSKSAQSYHGHVYIDEYFWITKFDELYKVATGMAAHKKWRRTLFSTPSAVTHQAYDLWTGDRFNKRWKRKNKRQEFPSLKECRAGAIGPDKVWRYVITLKDAEKGGCDLFDSDELRLEYSPDEFRNLFMCEFVDDTQSVFRLHDLEACYCDMDEWLDFDPDALRPFGDMPVWGGYDPSRHRDDSSFVILAPPLKPGGKFRILARFKWVNKSFSWQAERIKELTERFNFVHIGIDITGPGYGVFENVKAFFPAAMPIHYSLTTKIELVLKGKDVIESGRLEWDAGQSDIAHAFLTIRQDTTSSGMVTYSAGRTEATGHADVAWAIMHALYNEPLNVKHKQKVIIA